MKIVRISLQGGIGNQLFTYFAAADYALRSKKNLILDLRELDLGISKREFELNQFVLPLNYSVKEPTRNLNFRFLNLKKIMFRLRRYTSSRSTFESRVVGFDSHFDLNSDYKAIRGYFQTYRYCNSVLNMTGTRNIPIKTKSSTYVSLESQINACKPIIIHIRRGDYHNVKETIGLLAETYYLRALKKIPNWETKPVWVFTDDELEIRNSFAKMRIDAIIGEQYGITSAETIKLMSLSDHLIISNSSFSWWAAKLSSEDSKIYCPKKWFKGMHDPDYLYPEKWIQIESSWI